ncbi:autotransporter domain-containing protein [Pseudodesulfovibrio sp.]|uniref:autotransporter domain-containing protein n=1 Tax=unclassified Pseudodesulfovibrio TaxID=2661612 RepID=UPI003B00BB37
MPFTRLPYHFLPSLLPLSLLFVLFFLCPSARAADVVNTTPGSNIVVSGDGGLIAYQNGGSLFRHAPADIGGATGMAGYNLLGMSRDGQVVLGYNTATSSYHILRYEGGAATPTITAGDFDEMSELKGIGHDGLTVFGTDEYGDTAIWMADSAAWDSSIMWSFLDNREIAAVSNEIGDTRYGVGTDTTNLPMLVTIYKLDQSSFYSMTYSLKLVSGSHTYTSGSANDIASDGSIAVGRVDLDAAMWNVKNLELTLTLLPNSIGSNTYNTSAALAVNSDGSAIAGWVSDQAAYWTRSDSTYTLHNLYDDLTADGVTLPNAGYLGSATGVSDDGSIIVGTTIDSKVFIARISGGASGVITPEQLNQSLGAMGQVGPAVTGMGQLAMNRLGGVAGGQGMHFAVSGPASAGGTAGTGKQSGLSSGDEMSGTLNIWTVGSVGTNIELNGDDLGLHGGVGVTWERGEWRVGGGLFGDTRDLDTADEGNQDIKAIGPGAFVAYSPEDTGLEFRLSGLWQTVDLDLRRGYANGTGYATSKGSTNADVFGLSGRVQWTRGVTDYLALTPFAEYTWQTTHIDGYSESGGPFPASFNSRDETSNSLRTGLRADAAILDNVETWAWAAWDHRFEDKSSGLGGSTLGLGSFTYGGNKVDQDWADVGIGASWDVTERLSANTSLGFALGCDDETMSDLTATVGLSYQIW